MPLLHPLAPYFALYHNPKNLAIKIFILGLTNIRSYGKIFLQYKYVYSTGYIYVELMKGKERKGKAMQKQCKSN
jgi:hypothetical protein